MRDFEPTTPEQRPPEKCTVVIPVYNGADLTEQCLRTVFADPLADGSEVVVVDNGSADRTLDILRAFGGRVQVITNRRNLGFAKACNQGARAARHPIVVFLNNDTEVQPGWLAPLAEVLTARSRAAAAGSRILNSGGQTIQHAGFVIRHDDKPVMLYRGFPPLPGIGDRRRCLQAVSGACMAVKREAFLALGGFDEAFVNGYEDVDFCLRVRRRGWEVWYVPESCVIHREAGTPGRFDCEDSNAELFRRRWQGRVRRDIHHALWEDGFEVINAKSRDLVAVRNGTLFSVAAGERCRVESLPASRVGRAAKIAALKTRHLPARLKYGRLLDAPAGNHVAAPRGRDGLKIAMVHPNLALMGGAEKLQIWMARGLQNKGHQVVIYTPAFNDAFWKTQLPESVEIRLLPPHPMRQLVPSKRLDALHYGRILARELLGFDLVMCHNPPAHVWVARARRATKFFPPCVWFCHSVSRVFYPDQAGKFAFNYKPIAGQNWQNEPLLRLQVKHAEKLKQRRYIAMRREDMRAVGAMDAVVANSRYLAEIIREVYGRESFVCAPGIPVRGGGGGDERDLVFLTVSSRSPQKNLAGALEAFRRFVKNTGRADARLRIVGDLTALEDFVPPAVRDELAGRLELTGMIHREEKLAGVYRSSFATIYIPVDEAFGLVPVESMLEGTPVIGSDHGGPSESVIHAQTGASVSPFDPAAVARAMEWLAALPDGEIRAMRAQARRHVMARYTMGRFIDELEQTLRTILAPPPFAAAHAAPESARAPAAGGRGVLNNAAAE